MAVGWGDIQLLPTKWIIKWEENFIESKCHQEDCSEPGNRVRFRFSKVYGSLNYSWEDATKEIDMNLLLCDFSAGSLILAPNCRTK